MNKPVVGFTSTPVRRLRQLLAEKKARHEAGCFVVEGPVLVRAAIEAGLSVVEEFVRDDAEPVSEAQVHWLDPTTIDRVASTVTAQPNIAVVRIPGSRADSASFFGEGRWILVADRVADPGNLGTMIRSAVAAGASAVITTPGSVDLYSPKVVRSAAGSLFAVPCLFDVALGDLVAEGWELVGTSSHDMPGTVAYDETDLSQSCAIVMGNEAAGLDASAPVSRWVTIPHAGPVESLNVAMACTVLCFELARQRKHHRQSRVAK